MLAEEALLATPLGHSMSGMSSSLPPPSHQQLAPSLPSGLNKTRTTELHDIPTKIGKPLDDASAYPLDYQRYHTLMYTHCAQQQHVGQMSAFRPWAPPKSFLHAYNAAAVAALCLSQEPPILQNPERVVRNTDRERFERTYQPNVALAPRKNITPKEMDRERERERERERIEREREREIERVRERERSRERERQRERENEKERERELQQLQQHTQRHEGFSNLRENDVQVHIKQERANTPCNMSPVTPPLPSMQIMSQMDEQHLNPHHRRSIASMPTDDETQPLSLSLYHHKRHIHAPPPQQHPLPLKSNNNGSVEILQQRRSSLQTSNSSSCSTSSSVSSVSPPEGHTQQQQQLLGLYHTFHKQQHQLQQQQQQHQQQILQTQHPRQSPRSISPTTLCKNNNNYNTHHYSPPHQQQQQQLLNNNNLSRIPEELSSSNEITSSTSPLPATAAIENVEEKQQQYITQHQYETQTIINTVNQHTKLLPTITNNTATMTSNTNNNNNVSNNNNNKQYEEINNSRIRINKNLMHPTNIMRSPTPPPATPTTTKTPKSPVAIQMSQQQQQQQYDYNKKQTSYVNFTQPQQQQPPLAAGLNLSTNKKHNYWSKFQHNGTRSHYSHTHMGSGEFELSTDTDDESVNGEPDSSINVLPPWEVAVEALRETKPKERERVLHLLQRLLHDNHQYRCANLKLNELLQKRETQIRELSEQVHHYRFLLDQRQQHQQQQQQQSHQTHLKEQEEPENLKSRVTDEKLCVPLKKSLRREPDMLLLDRKSPPRINNLIEGKRKIKEEANINDVEFVERKKTKSVVAANVDIDKPELDIKTEEIEEVEKMDSNEDTKTEHSPESSAKDSSNMQADDEANTDNEHENDENESEKSTESVTVTRAKNSQVTAQENANAKDGIIVGLDYEIQNNVDKHAVQNTEISLCTNDNAGEETDGSDNMDDEDDEDAVMDEKKSVNKKDLLEESNNVKQSTILEDGGNKATDLDEKLTDGDTDAEKSKDEQTMANNVCRLVATKTAADDSICKKVEKTEKRSKEMTYILAKKKKKKKERKERKEKRRAAAAFALAAAAKEIVATRAFEDVPHNGVRPPMVTKASKKQTPMTTNCELQQPQAQQQTIKQE